jgi:hypothetical protein
MTSIAIYVEGGGDGRDGKAALRQGFDALLDRQKNAARIRKLRWKLVLCGGRDTAFEAFQHATSDAPADIVALLVDAERPVANATSDGRVRHLASQDRWELGGVAAERVHLMTQCMEAWIIADAEQLAAYYGKDFRVSALPRRTVLDDEPKDSLYSALRAASKDTQKGTYSKIKHASELLKRVRPDRVAARCTSFRHFTGWLDFAITGALPEGSAGSTPSDRDRA